MQQDRTLLDILASLTKWGAVIGAGMLVLYFIALLAMQVFETVGEAISSISMSLGTGRGSEFHSIAVLCVIIIGIVGLAKVMTRK